MLLLAAAEFGTPNEAARRCVVDEYEQAAIAAEGAPSCLLHLLASLQILAGPCQNCRMVRAAAKKAAAVTPVACSLALCSIGSIIHSS